LVDLFYWRNQKIFFLRYKSIQKSLPKLISFSNQFIRDEEYIALLSEGVDLTTDCLSILVSTFSEFSDVGLVGPQLLGSVEAVTDQFNSNKIEQIDTSQCASSPQSAACSEHTRQVVHLPLSCVMIPREIWQKLNLFDSIYSMEFRPEVNLAFRVREMGYEILYVPGAKVIFRNQELDDQREHINVAPNINIDRLRLKARWYRQKSEKNETNSSNWLVSLRTHALQALFLDLLTPRPDTNAGGYAAIKEMQVLQCLGYQITFVPKNVEHDGLYTNALQRMGIECIYFPFYSDINEFLRKRGNEFSLIYITRYHVAQSILPILRQYAPAAKIVLMLADLHFLRELRAALHNKNDEQLSQAVETRDNELAVMRKVDLVLSYSDVEKTVILSHNLASTKVEKCPWVCDVVESASGFENRVDIAFLGGFNHSPNVEAMFWFIERVWPDLLEQLPEAQLRIYGSAIPQSIKDLAAAKARIQVLGWVSDVASVYNNCRVFIAPLQSGAGIKGKVIGALAHGVPSVLSDIAVEGIGVCDEIHAFVASSPDEWVNRIMTLYTDQVLWQKMSQHALSFAKRHYSLDNAIIQMKAAFSSIGIEPISEPKALVWKGPWRSVAQV